VTGDVVDELTVGWRAASGALGKGSTLPRLTGSLSLTHQNWSFTKSSLLNEHMSVHFLPRREGPILFVDDLDVLPWHLAARMGVATGRQGGASVHDRGYFELEPPIDISISFYQRGRRRQQHAID
jgi:hypothetical protein